MPNDLKQTIFTQLIQQNYPPVLTQKHVKSITGHSDSFIEQARLKGEFIPYVKIGRSVRYLMADVVEYLAGLKRLNSTAEDTQEV